MQFGCPGASTWMLIPSSLKGASSSFSKVVAEPTRLELSERFQQHRVVE
jgi:hypothetical protein